MTELAEEELQPHCLLCARPQTAGLLCNRDADNLRRWLTEIPDMYAIALTLDIRERPAGQQDGSRHTKISGSPALINLQLMAIQDPSSKMGDGIVPVKPAILGWATMFAEEQQLKLPGQPTLFDAIALFTTWWSTLLRQPWIDEMHVEVHDIHRMLASATNAPKSIGRCFGWVRNAPPCGQKLYPAVDGTEVVCDKCGRRYSGLDLVRLELSQQRGA